MKRERKTDGSKEQRYANVGKKVGSTKKCKAEVIAAIKKHRGLLASACNSLRISSSCMSQYIKRWPEIQEEIYKAKGKVWDNAENELYDAAENGEPWAISIILLKSKEGRARGYGDKVEVALDANVNHHHQHNHLIVNMLKSENGENLLAGIAEQLSGLTYENRVDELPRIDTKD